MVAEANKRRSAAIYHVRSFRSQDAVGALVARARKALADEFGREPVIRIAERSGYDSEAAFSRAFKREFGVPPASWRRAEAS